jgi:ferredoxin-NADP reductase
MTAWLDRLLGRVTMYGLVIIALSFVGVVALVLSLLGWFPWGPLEILASAGVLLLASYVANGLIARLFKVRPQLSSTIITALLLLFIFRPGIDPIYLMILALAAVVAVLTKYLLAIRGRHLFNPAAAAALIMTLIPPFQQAGISSSWWLGTPIMLPFTAIAAFAILFRTRKLWLGLIFLVVAAGAMTVYSALNGLPIDIPSAFLSTPIVFFAGFMLSEPLTLPPRRWQQNVEAVVVGLLFTPGISVFGLFFSSPQFALVFGNLLAWVFGQRRGIRLSYIGKRQLTPTSWEFEFESRHRLRFLPGQYMELTLPHARTDARGWRRVFSIASAPGDGSRVRFGIRLPERPSSFKKALLSLEPGTAVTATSVGGDFVLPGGDSPLLLVAGGIGITPYISQLEQLTASGSKRDVALVYAISRPDDLAYADMLAKTSCAVTVVAATKPAGLPKNWTWVEAQRLTGDQLLAAIPDARKRHTFLSGTPTMVAALKRALRRGGVRRIHTDVFIGY